MDNNNPQEFNQQDSLMSDCMNCQDLGCPFCAEEDTIDHDYYDNDYYDDEIDF